MTTLTTGLEPTISNQRGFPNRVIHQGSAGKNRYNDDNLYRIAPNCGIVDLVHRQESWKSHLEFLWADAQDGVSETQAAPPGPGYGLINLHLVKRFDKTLRVEAGV